MPSHRPFLGQNCYAILEHAMLIAHLPSGYILGSLVRQRTIGSGRAIMAAALLGNIVPDLDMLYFHLIDGRRTHHHDYFSHWPLFWLVAYLTVAVVLIAFKRSWLPSVLVFFAGTMMHMVLDTVAAPIRWFAPFSDLTMELVQVPKIHPNWIVSFVLHWTFIIELAICTGAALLVIRRRYSGAIG